MHGLFADFPSARKNPTEREECGGRAIPTVPQASFTNALGYNYGSARHGLSIRANAVHVRLLQATMADEPFVGKVVCCFRSLWRD